MSDIMSYLFETKAVKFCEENKPFWYTSGKIGPYFINTHFLYGNEQMATEFLSFIDDCLSDKNSLPKKVFEYLVVKHLKMMIYSDTRSLSSMLLTTVCLFWLCYLQGYTRTKCILL